jgi:hypothetical protein
MRGVTIGLGFHLAKQYLALAAGNLPDCPDPGRLDGLVLDAEPAPLGKIFRECLALDRRAGGAGKRTGKAVAKHQRDVFGHGLWRLRMPRRRIAR